MQRKKANNNVTKSKNQRENKKQTKDKQTCSRQSWRSASATHVATVATSLERVLNTSKNTFRCWLLTIWMKRKVSFLVTWRTPIRQDMGRHESPSGQFQSTWCLLKNKTISVLRFSQILLQMQLYWSLKDHLKITFIVLFPHLIKALPFSKSKGMVWLPIVFVCSTTTSSELSLPTRPHFYLTPVTPLHLCSQLLQLPDNAQSSPLL